MPDKCRSCGAEIIWRRTESNLPHPVDPEPHPEGTITLHEDGVHLRVVPRDDLPAVRAAGTPLYRTHFASCPQAKKWRKK